MVTIKVSGAISDNGSIKIAIYESESDFDKAKNAVASESSLIIEGESVWTIPHKQLPTKFVVAAYHDENGDDLLNRNRLGIPIERYGFSQKCSWFDRTTQLQTIGDRPPDSRAVPSTSLSASESCD